MCPIDLFGFGGADLYYYLGDVMGKRLGSINVAHKIVINLT